MDTKIKIAKPIIILVWTIVVLIVILFLYYIFSLVNNFSESFKPSVSINIYGIGNLIEVNDNVIYNDGNYYYRNEDEFFKDNELYMKNCNDLYDCKTKLIKIMFNNLRENNNDSIEFEFATKTGSITYQRNNLLTIHVFENVFEYIFDDKKQNITFIDAINPIYFTEDYFYFVYFDYIDEKINYRLYRYSFSENRLNEIIFSNQTNLIFACKEDDGSIVVLNNDFKNSKRNHRNKLDLHLASKLYRVNPDSFKKELIFETSKKEFILGYHHNYAYVFKNNNIQKINIKTSGINKVYSLQGKKYSHLEVYAIKDKLFIYDDNKLLMTIDYNE